MKRNITQYNIKSKVAEYQRHSLKLSK